MCRDIIMALVGGVIGFMSSLGILIAQHIFDKKGRVSIYYKFVPQFDNQKPWGVNSDSPNETSLFIPAVFEFQNTQNITRVLRDVHASLYKGDRFVVRLRQATKTETTTKKEKEKITETTLYGTDNSSYSFVLSPRSIQKQLLEFVYTASDKEISEKDFDTIRISYYDEKDIIVSYIAKEKIKGWKMGEQTPNIEWIKLSKRVKK